LLTVLHFAESEEVFFFEKKNLKRLFSREKEYEEFHDPTNLPNNNLGQKITQPVCAADKSKRTNTQGVVYDRGTTNTQGPVRARLVTGWTVSEPNHVC